MSYSRFSSATVPAGLNTRTLASAVAFSVLSSACVLGSTATSPPAITDTTAEPAGIATTSAAGPTSQREPTAAPATQQQTGPTGGTPFGTFSGLDNVDETFERFSASRFLFGSPDEAIQYLELARATETQIVFSLVQARNMKNSDGTFSEALWKAEVDRFAEVDFAPYVEDGTILAHYMIDEPKTRGTWGGRVVPNSIIDELAAHSKSLWPSVPTAVRNSPTRLVDHANGHQQPAPDAPMWKALDIAWIQYNAGLHGDIGTYVTTQAESAARQQLDVIVGLQALAGGDGSSGLIPDPPFTPNFYIMSYDEMMEYGSYLLEQELGCAFITFRWQRNDETYFDGQSELARAHDDLQALAEQYDPPACTVR